MDQLRKLMQWLKRYHFWVLTVVAAAIAVVCWYFSTATFSQKFAQGQATIEGVFRTQDEIARKEFHPNNEINAEQRKQIELRAASVADTWRQLYDRQRAEALKWPLKELGPDFCNEVDKLKFGAEIPPKLRQKYRDYIREHFQELPKIIQARVIEGGGPGGGFGLRSRYSEGAMRNEGAGRSGREFGGQPIEENYVCLWLDQLAIRNELDFPETPSTLQIWVTQENLWAYHTILNAIANTNAGADRPSNAKVRTIQSLEVGQAAAKESRTSGRFTLAAAVTAPIGAAGEYGVTGGARPDVPIAMEGRSSEGPLSPEQERVKLLSGRYLDEHGLPIPINGGTDDYQTAFGGEYKRLPVRVVLEMDELALSDLISECANQPLPVEVQEVRINPLGGAGGTFGRERSARSFESRSSSRGSFRPGTIEAFPVNPHFATVFIQGVIYIYNEPNKALLQPSDVAALGP